MIPEGMTDRLILRPLEMADAVQIQELFPRWEIVRFMTNSIPWPYPPDGALQFVSATLHKIERGEAWHWSIRLRSDPSHPIGVIGVFHANPRESNRGFWIGKPWQGHGYMSEACVWVNDFWFETLGFPVLRVSKAVANAASRRISEKHGMRVVAVEEREYVSGRLPSEVWEITAEEWRAWKAQNMVPKGKNAD
jgi:RimJ/RimL family protein N-acetyltransferase